MPSMLFNPVSLPPPYGCSIHHDCVITASLNPTAFMLHGPSLHNTEQPSVYI